MFNIICTLILSYAVIGSMAWASLMLGTLEDWRQLIIDCIFWPRLVYRLFRK